MLKKILITRQIRTAKKALLVGDYDLAKALGRSETISEELKEQILLQTELYRSLTQGEAQNASLDRVVAMMVALPEGISQENRALLMLGRVAAALENHETGHAHELSLEIPGKEIRSQALRKIGCHLAVARTDPERSVAVLREIPIAAYAQEELRNLFLSRLLTADFDFARNMFETMPQQLRAGFRRQLEFIETHYRDPVSAHQNAWRLGHEDDQAMSLAIIAGIQKDDAGMIAYTRQATANMYVGLHQTFATSLAYAGRLSRAVDLLEGIRSLPGPFHVCLGHLGFNFPSDLPGSASLRKELFSAEPTDGTLTYWHHYLLTLLMGNNLVKACDFFPKMRQPELRHRLGHLLAGLLWEVQQTAGIHSD